MELNTGLVSVMGAKNEVGNSSAQEIGDCAQSMGSLHSTWRRCPDMYRWTWQEGGRPGELFGTGLEAKGSGRPLRATSPSRTKLVHF